MRYEPFAGLDPAVVERIARHVEIEYFAAGEAIFEQGQEPPDRVRMVITGAVELLDRGRVLDLLGPGELFGHPSMLAGLPTGFAARAHEDTLCYRLPGEQLLPVLTAPEGLRYVARSLLARGPRPDLTRDGAAADPARRPVTAFLREAVVVCEPSATVREVAREMAQRGAGCALVALPDGEHGIVTDQDLRVRVVGGDVGLDAAIAHAMTAPAFTMPASSLGTDVMVEMLNRGIRHVPVVSARGEIAGVVTDVDLLAAETRTPFTVRRNIARAADVEELVAAAQDLRPTLIALHDARVAPTQLSAIIAAFADALSRRALELLTAGATDLPPLVWLATGSMGRQEAFPSSDVDSALAWAGDAAQGDRLRALAGDVLDVLERCRFVRDPHAASADRELFAQSADEWEASLNRWLDRPDDPRLLIVIAVLGDARPVHATGPVGDPLRALREARDHPLFLAQLRRQALAHRPPTGFLRDIVVQDTGEHRGSFDIKQGGLLPVVGLARCFGLAAGTRSTSTVERLHAGAAAGELTEEEARTLEEAFELFVELRMDHQLRALRDGREPTDFIHPAELNPLMRRYLREAFRAIARVQRRLA